MERNRKILFISRTLLLQKFYQTLPLEIVKQTGWETKLLLPPMWKAGRRREVMLLEKRASDFYEIVVAPVYLNGYNGMSFFGSQLRQLLQNFKPDIVDVECRPGSLLCWQTIRNRNHYSPGSKIVLRYPGTAIEGLSGWPRMGRNRLQHQVEAHIITSLQWEESGQTDQLLFRNIPSGVDTDVFRPRELPELSRKINPDGKTVVGALGFQLSNRSLKLLANVLPAGKSKLLIFGNGGFGKKRHPGKPDPALDITVIPHASHEEMAQYLNCIQLFLLLPSRGDAPEKKDQLVLESLASAVPVLTSAPQKKPAAGIIPYTDLKQMGELLGKYVRHPQKCRTAGWQGRKEILQQYAWQKIAARTAVFYQEVMENPLSEP